MQGNELQIQPVCICNNCDRKAFQTYKLSDFLKTDEKILLPEVGYNSLIPRPLSVLK